jgi:beta-lactamase superfamily II metal-dependent hydrolase
MSMALPGGCILLHFAWLQKPENSKKWEWITARIEKSPADHRPENHKVYVHTINVGNKISTANGWASRPPWWKTSLIQ